MAVFFIRRYKHIKGFENEDSPELMAKNLVSYCFKHIQKVLYQGNISKIILKF